MSHTSTLSPPRGQRSGSDDDLESVWSDISAPHLAPLTLQDAASMLDEAIDKMTQRRTTTRVEGMLDLNKLMSRCVLSEAISKELDTLSTLLLNTIKRGSEAEVVAASHALELLGLTLGIDKAEALLATMASTLRRQAGHHDDAAVRKAALRSLALLSFLSTSTEHDDVLHWLKYFARFVRRREATVAAAALDAWGLVASNLPARDLVTVSAAFLKTMVALLHSDSLEVRSAAGENIALMHEAQWEIEGSDGDDDDEDSEDDADTDDADDDDTDEDGTDQDDSDEFDEKDEKDNLELLDDEDVDVEQLSALLETLSKDGSRSRARKERARQRSLFRDVLTTVEEGVSPRVTLKIAGQTHKFGTWKQISKLSGLRQTLAEGYHVHIAGNHVVREILEVEHVEVHEESVLKARREKKDKSQVMYEMRLAARARQDAKKSSRKNKRAFMNSDY